MGFSRGFRGRLRSCRTGDASVEAHQRLAVYATLVFRLLAHGPQGLLVLGILLSLGGHGAPCSGVPRSRRPVATGGTAAAQVVSSSVAGRACDATGDGRRHSVIVQQGFLWEARPDTVR